MPLLSAKQYRCGAFRGCHRLELRGQKTFPDWKQRPQRMPKRLRQSEWRRRCAISASLPCSVGRRISRQVVTARGRPLELILIDKQTGKASSDVSTCIAGNSRLTADGWRSTLRALCNRRFESLGVALALRKRIGFRSMEQETKVVRPGLPMGISCISTPDALGSRTSGRSRSTVSPRNPLASRLSSSFTQRPPLTTSLGKAVTRDKFFWSMQEMTGNIWVAERETPDRRSR